MIFFSLKQNLYKSRTWEWSNEEGANFLFYAKNQYFQFGVLVTVYTEQINGWKVLLFIYLTSAVASEALPSRVSESQGGWQRHFDLDFFMPLAFYSSVREVKKEGRDTMIVFLGQDIF